MKFAKPGILYVEAAEKMRANDWSTMAMSVTAGISKPRTNRNLASFRGLIRQNACQWAQRRRACGSDAEASLCVHLGSVSPPKELIVGRVARGRGSPGPSQKLPSTAIYCHLVAAKPLRPFQPYISCASRACRPAWVPG